MRIFFFSFLSFSLINHGLFSFLFAGSSDDWASPKDQRAWFADISGAILV